MVPGICSAVSPASEPAQLLDVVVDVVAGLPDLQSSPIQTIGVSPCLSAAAVLAATSASDSSW